MPPKRLKIVEPKKKPKKKVPKRLKIVEEKKIEPKKKPVKKKKLPKKLNIKPEKKKMVKKMPKRLRIVEAPPLEETHPELTAITGLSGVEANAMTPLALFGLLPKELGQMVLNPSQRGGGVKVGNKSPLELVEQYDSLTIEEAMRYKGGRMKSLDKILKDIGKQYGRLPKTSKVNYAYGQDAQFGRGTMKFRTGSVKLYADVELFKLYTKRFGSEFASHVGEILKKRLSPKNFKPEKQYQKELAKYRVRKANNDRVANSKKD